MTVTTPEETLVTLEQMIERCERVWNTFVKGNPEQKVWDAFPTGSFVDLENRELSAEVLARLLCGAVEVQPGQVGGIRLAHARVTGKLDRPGATLKHRLWLKECYVPDGIDLSEAKTQSLTLRSCRVGAIDLSYAKISGVLDLNGADLDGNDGDALNAQRLTVTGNMLCSKGFQAKGEINLAGASIGGQLNFNGADLDGKDGRALNAQRLTVTGTMLCGKGSQAKGFQAKGLQAKGSQAKESQAKGSQAKESQAKEVINFTGASIGGQLNFNGADLDGNDGRALNAQRLTVADSMLCSEGFQAKGEINLTGASIGGEFALNGAALGAEDVRTLNAESLRVGEDMSLSGGFVGGGGGATVNLTGADVGGELNCAGAKLRNSNGPALHAHGLRVGQGMLLIEGFEAFGTGKKGAVRLTGARIGGELNCGGAILGNDSGPALRACRLQVDGDMYLDAGFAAIGSGDRAAVRLTGARIGGHLNCIGAILRNGSGPALFAYGVQIGQDLYLTGKFDATGGVADNKDQESVTVNLRAARVGGAFEFNPKRLENNRGCHRRLAVDGLTYSGRPEPISPECWREFLRCGTPSYAGQPYQQLAAGCKAVGDERQVRETLMAQRDHELARTGTRRREKLWGWITKVTLGYGYKPWKALLFLAGVVVVSCVLALLLGAHGALKTTDKTAYKDQSCSVVQQLSVGLDLNLPVGTSVARAKCDLTKDSASTTAKWLTAASWVMRVLAWVFAALFIAGFTGAVRKT